MAKPIIFYDVPGNAHPDKAWSPNTQKIRFALNFKGLAYRTVWVEYPDIATVAQKIGAKPAPTIVGISMPTVPMIYDPSTDTAMSDSSEIVKYLDKQYPSETAIIPAGTDALQAIFVHTFENLRSGLTGVLFPLVVAAINAQLNPYSEEYFRRTREVFLGQRLEDLRPPGPQREQALEELRGQLDALSKHLDRNGEGKVFVMGDTVSFADFVLGGSLSCAKLMLPAEEWQAVESWNGGRWGKHVEAMRAYAAIDEGEIWRREA